MDVQNFEYWTVLLGMVAIIGFLWRLSNSITRLSERVAKIEGFLFSQGRRDPASPLP